MKPIDEMTPAELVLELNDIHNLGDAIYTVRGNALDDDPEYTGSSWDHPVVQRYSDLVGAIREWTESEATK